MGVKDFGVSDQADVVVIGAGIAGLCALHRLRQLGLTVRAFESGKDVGGVWYWNRYPGARFDSESYIYQYLFSEELYKGWSWSEKFPGQPEIERWLNYVADRLDLRKDIQFATTVKGAHFNEATQRWLVTTDRGDVIEQELDVADRRRVVRHGPTLRIAPTPAQAPDGPSETLGQGGGGRAARSFL